MNPRAAAASRWRSTTALGRATASQRTRRSSPVFLEASRRSRASDSWVSHRGSNPRLAGPAPPPAHGCWRAVSHARPRNKVGDLDSTGRSSLTFEPRLGQSRRCISCTRRWSQPSTRAPTPASKRSTTQRCAASRRSRRTWLTSMAHSGGRAWRPPPRRRSTPREFAR